jgi:hypothetical protein
LTSILVEVASWRGSPPLHVDAAAAKRPPWRRKATLKDFGIELTPDELARLRKTY